MLREKGGREREREREYKGRMKGCIVATITQVQVDMRRKR
jgi:hypothetical protein